MRKARHAYYLRFRGAPLCDCIEAEPVKAAGVSSCSYPNRAAGLVALRALEAQPGHEGSASLHEGMCPRLSESFDFELDPD